MNSKIKEAVGYTLLILMGTLFVFPLIVTFTNSFMTELAISINYTTRLLLFDVLDDITNNFARMRLIPNPVSLEQYAEILVRQPSFLILLTNSLKITLPVVAGNLIVSILAAYGFNRWSWRHKEAVFFVYIIVMLMPLQAVLVPNYIIAERLNIRDSYLAIILPGIFAPFGTFLLRQGLKGMPEAYFEAAEIDGASMLYILINIVIPQMKSCIAALSMLVFIEYWNLVEQSVIFIKDYYREPLSVYLSRIAEGKIGLIFAASCVYMLLPFWFLVLGQKDLESGIELSGIK